MVHKAQHFAEGFVNGVASFGFNYGGNSVVKHTQDGVVLGRVTSREVLMLHPYEHHLDLMSVGWVNHLQQKKIHISLRCLIKLFTVVTR